MHIKCFLMKMGEQEVWRGRGFCYKRIMSPLSQLPSLRYSSGFDRGLQQPRQRRENRLRLNVVSRLSRAIWVLTGFAFC